MGRSPSVRRRFDPRSQGFVDQQRSRIESSEVLSRETKDETLRELGELGGSGIFGQRFEASNVSTFVTNRLQEGASGKNKLFVERQKSERVRELLKQRPGQRGFFS